MYILIDQLVYPIEKPRNLMGEKTLKDKGFFLMYF